MWQTLSGAYKDDREEDGSRQRRIIRNELKRGRVGKRGKIIEEKGNMKEDENR
jgi:hypothetical protein